MAKQDLESLSKDELIQIVTNFKNRESVSDDDLDDYRLDYHALLEATSDIILYIDREGNIRYINSAWKEYYPSIERNLRGHYSQNIPAIELERGKFVFEQVISKGLVIDNEMMKTVNERGESVYFTASFSPFKNREGKIIGLIGIMKNITEYHLMSKRLKANAKILEEKVKEEMKQAEELKHLRDFNEEIINNAPIGIFVMDLSGVVLSENQALKDIMGRKGDETLVGVNLLDYEGFTKSGFGKLFRRGISEKKTIKESNVIYTSISGRDDMLINVTVDPIMGKTGSVEKILIMVEDNTQQARTAKRAQKVEQLSALGFLASGVATELRNHVNKMVMDLNFVQNNLASDSPAGDYVSSLNQELTRIKNISEQLVSLAIADETEREKCDVNKLITAYPLDIMLNRLKNEGYDIKLSLGTGKNLVLATANQVQQILLQFVENAAEAMPNKGSITITTDLLDMSTGKYVCITVADTGIGIPEENLGKVFQPFYTTKGKTSTGLGLMIAAAIVENLGGTIGVKSRPGEGTTIKVIIPQAVK